MAGLCLVVLALYIVHTTKTEVDHNLWGVYWELVELAGRGSVINGLPCVVLKGFMIVFNYIPSPWKMTIIALSCIWLNLTASVVLCLLATIGH